jgi:2-keto-4-pentenoate hydratase
MQPARETAADRPTPPADPETDPFLRAALAAQLERRRGDLLRGATRVGWKLGTGDAESIGGDLVVGYLTSATTLADGGAYDASADADLHADVEVAVEFEDRLAPGSTPEAVVRGFRAALELVDLSSADEEADLIVAENVFHRAVAFGPLCPLPLPENVRGSIAIDGAVRGEGAAGNLFDPLERAAQILASVDEAILAGDRVITGSLTQVPVCRGDVVTADLGALGSVALRLS